MAAHALDVDREAVRLLALQYGVEEAATRTGLSLNTVKAWSARFQWFARNATKIATNATKPGDSHLAIMEERKRESAASLSKYVVDASAKLRDSKGNLKLARSGKDVVAIRSGVYPEQNTSAGFSLNVLNVGGNIRIGGEHEETTEKQINATEVQSESAASEA